ncbi:hypothetical protein KFE25_006374 [Diacronema lutheri]|uniref:Uncharacterized protein n=1 Tax=Diacronema lutheri TaxID=2081491 RepID=A0A8J5XSX2_DIALT|nr:hypothetical protein KFE25_006374 [Diacronema lutheri]
MDSIVPAHRTMVPAKSCLKGATATGKVPRASITIRDTPEKRLISPRSDATRNLFYTDVEYERFQREAASLSWLLEGAIDEDVPSDVRKVSHGSFDGDLCDLVADAQRDGVATGVPFCGRATHEAPSSCGEQRAASFATATAPAYQCLPFPAPRATELACEKRVPLGAANRHALGTRPLPAARGVPGAGEPVHKLTRLEREIESMNMHELKDKIKEITQRRRERAHATRPYTFYYR